MSSGITAVEYSVDAGPRVHLDYDGEQQVSIQLTSSTEEFGYVIVEIWVYDVAGNVGHDVYWYGLEEGHIVSVQPLYDGRFRVAPAYARFKVEEDERKLLFHTYEPWKWKDITENPWEISFEPEWSWDDSQVKITVLIKPKEYRCD